MATMVVWLWSMLLVSYAVQESRGSSVIGFGACPQPPVQQNFDVNQYTGVWYEYKRFPVPYEFLVTCAEARYDVLNASAISVTNTGIRDITIAGTLYPSVPAKLVVTLVDSVCPGIARGNYWVLDTDYATFSLVYSCFSIIPDFLHYDSAWILTRDRGVAPGNIDALYRLLTNTTSIPQLLYKPKQLRRH
ncbi:apolipoprotein D-like [Pomacea canaliculata]|uniref:apolipoprotein D-like n=1 Tax=Pomacea canaliculata TaxID=400727 RepID=UPI000D734346|nr:apolipoprotein D-like [Pomacea canaliculata]